MSPNLLTVFFSYSHKDEELRDELAIHLKMMERQGLIGSWHDRLISGGTEWANAIDDNLNIADVILLLISANFLASDYCYDIELKRAMERHEAGEARVIPIVLKPCDWTYAPFGKLQALPQPAKPVTQWSDRDEAFLNISQGLRLAVKEFAQQKMQLKAETISNQKPKSSSVTHDKYETCPYVGLNAFDQDTAKYFCGRDSQIALLLSKIEASRFVPVIGASGSGKSSLVKAGLIPALEKQGWCILPSIKPWTDPLAILKKALVEQFYKLPREIQKAYAKLESEGLNAILPEGSQRVLLVVDQFEELFTVCANEDDRKKFIRLLAEGADREGRLTIATTMRADFVEQALQYADLAKLIQRDRAFWLVPLEPSELRQAIAEPAKMQGYELTEGLLEVICQDVEAEKNSLPLLEFALTELWERRNKQNLQLTLTAYAKMGKLRGALDRHAKRLYEDLPSDLERDWARRLFLQLVRTGQDVRDTRQRQAKQFLLGMAASETDQEEIANLLEIFAGAEGRLLTTGEENNAAFVDLAHEALMDGWEMFRDWRSQDRDLRRLGDRVKDAFDEYQNALDKDKFLLSEGVVAQIEEVEAEIADYLTSEQQKFVRCSRYKYKPWLDPANLPEMVDIPSGTFWMGAPEGKGSDNEKPYHQVTVKAFQIGKYPVTQAQWRTVAMSPKVAIDLSLNPSYHRGDDCPVEKVDWGEAQEFCARLSKLTGESYCLPSEAEWEYACLAGAETYTEYYFGDDEGRLGEYAWYSENSDNKTHPVGQKLPNAWGLYDLHGNVWEWCADDWHHDYEGAPSDSQIWVKDIITNYEVKKMRGGSQDDDARNCRSAFFKGSLASNHFYVDGFRVVCSFSLR